MEATEEMAIAEATPEVIIYDFDDTFQSKIASLSIRDTSFLQRTDGLVRPEYFENSAEGVLVNIGQRYYQKYKKAPDPVTMVSLIGEDKKAKIIRDELMPLVKAKFAELVRSDISDRDYVVEKVAEFARHQAVIGAIEQSVGHLDKRDFTKIEKAVKDALNVGANVDAELYDYYEEIDSRTLERKDRAAGKLPPTGISTGFPALDKFLYHKGWGKRELSVLMGGAKAGKSTALLEFGRAASMAGKNVIYVTLEVAARIISERIDANIADVPMDELGDKIMEINRKIETMKLKSGKFHIMEFPTGSLTVADLRRLLDRQKAKGIIYDMVIVDYADLMAPERYTDNSIENSKNVYVGLRGLAMQENVALLTATQTNRDGFKSSVAKAEHVSEDFNKIRIADIVISINRTEEERAVGQARLYFAASRNQAGQFTVRIKQDMERMRFISEIIGEE
ncbi:DnaB Replicative DNA helicase [uncultured Caudovirales phage]|uniref:DnaB Replicative DNA helicase n=1 Tax=uncultured Caudovirales phage TaxID=2100421 RepID=A0A6J7WP74_9CAUD|nr:DnaB Replicative DNA helicase [uncultured Caudovirales phage]CAB4123990.1 DnaB Replicative DNA helicase [uncultured Caudovirales phage]CAB5219590.1 DnaB Replicative DNA helicase [uncultured Caudovirales phage]